MPGIHYSLIEGGKRGLLHSALQFETPIKGYSVNRLDLGFYLAPDGLLTDYEGFKWDFGSRAIDTPGMVIASAFHDPFCTMTDLGLIPWECRAIADKHFRELLKENGVSFPRRWWCWTGVRSYSKFVAYWRAEK